MTQTLKASDVRSNWSQLLNKVFRGETEVLVEKSGIPIAAIVSAQDYQNLQQIKQQREEDFVVINKIRTAFKDQSSEQIEANVSQAIAQVRKENKQKTTPK